jgi:hypothetical protein
MSQQHLATFVSCKCTLYFTKAHIAARLLNVPTLFSGLSNVSSSVTPAQYIDTQHSIPQRRHAMPVNYVA